MARGGLHVDRASELLLSLEHGGSWMTAARLSSELGCSVRTVKTIVRQLNQDYPGILESSSKGYRIGDPTAVESALAPLSSSCDTTAVPQTATERRTRILCQLLMRRHEVSVDELARDLCISPTTLDHEIQAINTDLADGGVSLRIQAGKLSAEGDEADKRRAAIDLLFCETHDFFNQLELVSGYFPDIDIKGLRTLIDDSLHRAGFYINGFSLSNLILHLAIALERCVNGFAGAASARTDSPDITEEVRSVTEDIFSSIEAQYGVALSSPDRHSFALLLSTGLCDSDRLASGLISNEGTRRLIEHVKARVMAEYSIDLNDGEFAVRFALHVENLIARSEQGVVLRNPQLGTIKNAYPYVYEIAVFIAEVIHSETSVQVSEDEIALIALHVGCFIEEQAARGKRLRAFVVSPRYNALGQSLVERLETSFADDLLIEGAIEEPDDLRTCGQVDLIITTQELMGRFGAPVVRISPYIGEIDRALIRERIDSIRTTARKRAMERNLYAFFRSDLFYIDTGFTCERDVIEFMGPALERGGFAFPGFTESLFARERVSSSAYRDIALPHPIDMDAARTAVAVSLHPRAIMWNGSPVHAVFMLAVAKKDRLFYREVFEFVAHVLNEPDGVIAVSRARTFEEFVETLLSYYR